MIYGGHNGLSGAAPSHDVAALCTVTPFSGTLLARGAHVSAVLCRLVSLFCPNVPRGVLVSGGEQTRTVVLIR